MESLKDAVTNLRAPGRLFLGCGGDPGLLARASFPPGSDKAAWFLWSLDLRDLCVLLLRLPILSGGDNKGKYVRFCGQSRRFWLRAVKDSFAGTI